MPAATAGLGGTAFTVDAAICLFRALRTALHPVLLRSLAAALPGGLCWSKAGPSITRCSSTCCLPARCCCRRAGGWQPVAVAGRLRRVRRMGFAGEPDRLHLLAAAAARVSRRRCERSLVAERRAVPADRRIAGGHGGDCRLRRDRHLRPGLPHIRPRSARGIARLGNPGARALAGGAHAALLAYLGDCSYSVYLWHTFAISVILKV